MPVEGDLRGLRGKSDDELERMLANLSGISQSVGSVRAELDRRRREHTETLVNKQLEAAKGVKWATILAAIAAAFSAAGTIVQAIMAVAGSR